MSHVSRYFLFFLFQGVELRFLRRMNHHYFSSQEVPPLSASAHRLWKENLGFIIGARKWVYTNWVKMRPSSFETCRSLNNHRLVQSIHWLTHHGPQLHPTSQSCHVTYPDCACSVLYTWCGVKRGWSEVLSSGMWYADVSKAYTASILTIQNLNNQRESSNKYNSFLRIVGKLIYQTIRHYMRLSKRFHTTPIVYWCSDKHWFRLRVMQKSPNYEECSTVVRSILKLQMSDSVVTSLHRSRYTPPWRWRQHVSRKHRLILKGLQIVVSQKAELFKCSRIMISWLTETNRPSK
jgi:hypothetical protein